MVIPRSLARAFGGGNVGVKCGEDAAAAMSVLVAVTGGSGSGKSTMANVLARGLQAGCATLVSEDWYYRDFVSQPGFDPAAIDFDDIGARDHDLLIADLRRLKAGVGVLAPQYCFVSHQREPVGLKIAPTPVVIVEGAQLLCVPALVELFDLKLYLDTPDDIRFIRRLLRDQSERGRTVSSVVRQYLSTVRPAHGRLTAPSRDLADLVIHDVGCAVEGPDLEALGQLATEAFLHPALVRYRRSPA